MRIAIDARKLHDYGIGTYVRNLLQALLAARPTTRSTSCCAGPTTSSYAATLGPRFAAVRVDAGNYSVSEQLDGAARRWRARGSSCSTRRTTSSRRSRPARSS